MTQKSRISKQTHHLFSASYADEELRSEGVEMTAEQLRHLSPMDWEHIGLTGEYTWDFALKNARS